VGEGAYFALFAQFFLRKGFFLLGLFDYHGHVVFFFIVVGGRHFGLVEV
jgi:hypothetical protein